MKNTGDPNLNNIHSKIDTGNKKRNKSYGRYFRKRKRSFWRRKTNIYRIN